MNAYWANVLTTIIAVLVLWFLFFFFGRAWVYEDQYKAGLMSACQSNGYTWGECYNVIHGNQDSFTK
jgi:hypothetical protein